MKNFKNTIFDEVESLVNYLANNPNQHYLVIVMYKSQTCPPCNTTISNLTRISSNGKTNFDTAASDFSEKITEKNGHFGGVLLLTYDCSIPQNVPSEFLSNAKYSVFYKPILDASRSIRSVPTFMFFNILNNNVIKIPADQSGALDIHKFHMLLDSLVKHF